jgi:pilus assembly protein CpaD
MRRISPVILIAASCASLGACASGPRGALTATNNPSLYSVHQPVVQRTDYVLDLDASGDTLSAAERARLTGWFDAIELRYGDQLFVEEPRDYPSPGGRAGVAEVLAEYGMQLHTGAPVKAGAVAPGSVRVIASRATASVPGCPNWDDRQIVPTVNTSANYGCALNANLAAMVADPNDLVRGREGSVSGSANTANRAVRVYRDRTPTGGGALPTTSTSAGSGGN